MANLNKSVFTEMITIDARMILTGDVFLVAGLRAEVTAVNLRGDMIDVYYSVGGSNQQVGEFSTFVDGPFTLISRKVVPETKPPAIGANDVTLTCTKCWKLADECECDIKHAKVPTASVFPSDVVLENLREKLTGAPKHSCQWRDNLELVQAESERRRNLNISQAATIEALEEHIRELSLQLELERSEQVLYMTMRRIKKLKKKLSRGV